MAGEMMLKKYGWIALITGVLLVFWLGQQPAVHNTHIAAATARVSPTDLQNLPAAPALPASGTDKSGENLPDFLPPEAKTTLALIQSNGPFPHRQDHAVFQNREQRLPRKTRGYYHEYTVTTPGLNHRGARRIITGGKPVEIYYYTNDHYDSFREFEIQP